eukprot:TRINITY_DN3218_c0_g3_i2.p2 TRINITY_DN3218_c0_g3~~TRINITY_DN3218_c0_g3_i2.p2  ORF type:complete len:215 (-),score=7.52 TRINITY_DN3218_c0_g3_i2:210-854(-)
MVHITYGQGQYTQVIYSKIKDGKLEEAIEILRQKLQESPDNRAALSLLGYCFYQLGNYEEAGQMYEKLTGLFPENPEYLFYYAQCLYKEGIYDEASRIVQSIQGQHMKDLTSLLNVAITYEQDNVPGTRYERHVVSNLSTVFSMQIVTGPLPKGLLVNYYKPGMRIIQRRKIRRSKIEISYCYGNGWIQGGFSAQYSFMPLSYEAIWCGFKKHR